MWLSLKRPRFQFSIRSLLALMVAAAVGAGWYSWRLRAERMQEHAFLRIATKGGLVVHYQEGAFITFGSPAGGLCGTGLIHVYGSGAVPVTFSDQDLPLLDQIAVNCSINFVKSSVSAQGIQRVRERHPHWNVD